MGFCRISAQYKRDGYTMVENSFFNDFLLHAPAEAVRVYMWGLYISQNDNDENSLDRMAQMLSLSTADIISIYTYWQDRGVVNLCNMEPIHVIYNPVKTAIGNIKKFKIGKYNDFNLAIQSIFPNRAITQNELIEYYTVIESFKMEQSALYEIAKYAITIKGDNVGHRYITTIAKNWAVEKITTKDQVAEKILELSVYDDTLKVIMKALGSKARADINDKEMLDKWTKNMGYEIETICHIASNLKKSKLKADTYQLDRFITKYFEMKLYTIAEIDEYETNKQMLYTQARSITKGLGLYYEDLTKIVDTVVQPLSMLGYSAEMLTMMADFCFKQSIRTLDGYQSVVKKLHKLGIIEIESFNQYLQSVISNDEEIKSILSQIGINRRVNDYDRTFYNKWIIDWNIPTELIAYATELSSTKSHSLVYMNKILSNWHIAGIKTKADAEKATMPASSNITTKKADNFQSKQYTNEQLSSLFSNLDEIEV